MLVTCPAHGDSSGRVLVFRMPRCRSGDTCKHRAGVPAGQAELTACGWRSAEMAQKQRGGEGGLETGWEGEGLAFPGARGGRQGTGHRHQGRVFG